MKRIIYFIVIIFIGLLACKGNEKKESADQKTQTSATDSTATEGNAYVCPMNCQPGVISDKPGACPVCGMDLEVKV